MKEQESYLLGSVFDPQLTRALMSLFMDPDHTLDPSFTAAAGHTLLAYVNGFRQGQQQAARPVLPGSSPEDGRRLLRHGKWRLPALGKAPEQDTLLYGVRRAVVFEQVGVLLSAGTSGGLLGCFKGSRGSGSMACCQLPCLTMLLLSNLPFTKATCSSNAGTAHGGSSCRRPVA